MDGKYEEVEFIPLNKDRMLVEVIVTPSHINKAIIEYFEKKVAEYEY